MKDLLLFIADILSEPFKMAVFACVVLIAGVLFIGAVYLIVAQGTLFFYILAGVVGFILMMIWYAIIEITLELLG